MVSKIIVSGIEIEVNRKKIKNMYLKVSNHDGKVRISAPLRTKEDTIIKFVTSKIDWINKQKRKFEQSFINNQINYVDGEIHYVWGKPCILEIKNGSKGSVEVVNDKLVLTVNFESSIDQIEKILIEWYRKQLRARLPMLFEKWEDIIGVKAKTVTIRNMKSRWGSCNTRDKRISINLQLAKKPVECLEYVVVHELVHLLEPSHNPVFKRYLDVFMPNWREIKKKLI